MPAVAGIAGLDLVVIGFVALILAVALFPLFRPLISGALTAVPFIGGWLALNADLALFRAYTVAQGWIGQAISPAADLIRRLRLALALWTDGALTTAEATFNTLWRLINWSLPALETRAARYALQLMMAADAYAAQLARQVTAYALQLAIEGRDYALALAHQVSLYALALSAADVRYAEALYQRSIQYTQAAQAAETAFTQLAVRTAENYAGELFRESIDYTRSAVLGAEAYARGIAVDAEGYARALTDIAIGRSTAANAATAATAAAATAAVAEAVRAIENSPCMQHCGPLGNLGSLLQQLADLGIGALLLELAAEMARDPQGAARDVEQLLGDLVGGVTDAAVTAAGMGAGSLSVMERVGGPAWGG